MAHPVLISFGVSAVPVPRRIRRRQVRVCFGRSRQLAGVVSWPRSLAGWL